MALPYDELTAVSNKFLRPRAADTYYKSCALLVKLKASNRVNRNGGDPLTVPLIYAKNPSGGHYHDDGTLLTARGKKWTAVPFDWKFYYESQGLEETKRLRQGDKGEIKMLTLEHQTCMDTLTERIAEAMHADGTGGSYTDDLSVTRYEALDGLKGAVAAASKYPPSIGIDYSDVPTWRPGEDGTGVDTTTAGISPPVLNEMMVKVTYKTGPGLIITTKKLFSALWDQIQPQQQMSPDGDLQKAGFVHLMLNGVPVTYDMFCPTQYCYVLNLDGIEFYIHPEQDFSSEPWTKPHTQNVVMSKIWFGGNLCFNDRRSQGVFTGFTS